MGTSVETPLWKHITLKLLTATYIAAWPAWMLGALCHIGTVGLLVIMGIGYAAWFGKYYLLYSYRRSDLYGSR